MTASDTAQQLLDEERSDAGDGQPIWYGTPFDKLIVGAQIVFWWLITFPLIIWALIRTLLLYLLLFAVFLIPLALTVLVGLFLFTTTLYWTPAVSVALTQIAPLIAAAVQIGVFGLNIAWFILITLVDLWNILIPLFVVIFIYVIHFFITVITLIVGQLSSSVFSRQARLLDDSGVSDITSLFSDLIEVAFFFADIVVVVLVVVVGVLPQALTIAVTIAQPVLVLLFKSIGFLFPLLQFLIVTLIVYLPAVFFSVIKLVRVFSNMLRAAPLVGAALSYTPPSQSNRYNEGVAAYFDEMVQHSHDLDWDPAVQAIDEIRAGQKEMPDYSHLVNPIDPANRHKRRRRASDDAELPTSRGSLLLRYQSESTHAQTKRKRGTGERFTRDERAHVLGSSILEGMHSTVDHAAPLRTHQVLMQRTLDTGARTLFGYESAQHALDDYNRRYSHPMQLILEHTPDFHSSWLGQAVRASNPDDPFNAGLTWHDWRRSGYPPVEDHPHGDEANEQIRRHQPDVMSYSRKRMQQSESQKRLNFGPIQTPDLGLPTGDVPLPFEMPVLLGTDCFRSKPKFILCLPRPANRRFKAPDLLIPTNLPDPATCPGFIAPPNPDDGIDAVLEMLNPWNAIQNTVVYIRYIISAFSLVFYAINEQTFSNSFLGWFFDLLTITEDPLSTDELLCLIPFAWYSFYTAALLILAIGWFLPLAWLVFSLIVYVALPFRKSFAAISRLLRYYRISGDRVIVLQPRSAMDVSRQKWLRDRTIMNEDTGRMPVVPGSTPGDVLGQYDHLNSLRFDEGLIQDDVNVTDLFMLHQATKQLSKQSRVHGQSRRFATALVDAAAGMGAISKHVQTLNDARLHMSANMKTQPLMPHTATLAHRHDELTNVEVALGHRPVSDSVPLATWGDEYEDAE